MANNAALVSSYTLPQAVEEQLAQFQQEQVSGWIQLNFNHGDLQSWQIHEHRRIKK